MYICLDGEASKDDGFSDMDPRELLVKLMEKDGLRIVDLFRRLDEDESWTVSRIEFRAGIVVYHLIAFNIVSIQTIS